MKKLLSGILIVILGISIVGCGNANNGSKEEESTAQTETTPVQEGTDESNASSESSDNNTEEAVEQDAKTLIAYFSYSGNTKGIAEEIQSQTGADIFEIKTTSEYPSDYDEVLDVAQEEQQSNARPELNATVDNMDEYDVVFLGYPNWWGDMPMAVYTFLDTYDLSGKTVIPFCTHGGSGFSGTQESIAEAEPDAAMMEGLSIQDSNLDGADTEVANWLSGLGMF